MSFLVLALLPPATPDIQSAVARLMAPYDRATPAPPHNVYLSEQTVNGYAARWGLSPFDREALAARINAENAARLTRRFQADALGLYLISENNPNGKYTRWSLKNPAEDVWPVAALPPDVLPHAVITPDGEWHELFPLTWGRIPTAADRERMARETVALTEQIPGHLAVRLECHG
jgi:hypothetical protein